MAQIPYIDDQYINEVIKSAEAYNPELNKTQGVKLRELIKLLRDRMEQGGDGVVRLTGDQNITGTKSFAQISTEEISFVKNGHTSVLKNAADQAQNNIFTLPKEGGELALTGRLTKNDVGLGNVDNTADIDKPLSTPVKTYVDNSISSGTGNNAYLWNGNEVDVSRMPVNPKKIMVLDIDDNIWKTVPTSQAKLVFGLSAVNNTSDANKPVSIATQSALDTKAPLNSPTFTGSVVVPNPVASNQAATKEYVDTAMVSMIDSGTYVPVFTGVDKALEITPELHHWTRIGNKISVTGGFNSFNDLSGADQNFYISLPVASNLSQIDDVTGFGAMGNSLLIKIGADVSKKKALASFNAGYFTSVFGSYTFVYTIK